MPISAFKLLGIVVTFHPEIPDVINGIRLYLPFLDHLIFWINTPESNKEDYIPFFNTEELQKISFCGYGDNVGIGTALNHAIRMGIEKGFTHLLTMDQDSTWINFPIYVEAVRRNLHQYKIFAPTVTSEYDKDKDMIGMYSEDFEELKSAITSGSIYALDIFSVTGGFNEGYFIDAVDTEFGLRAYAKGFFTAKARFSFLYQVAGKTIVKGGRKTISYSAFRIYHIMRNHLWMWRQHPHTISSGMKKWIVSNFFLRRIPKIILLEDKKVAKLHALFLKEHFKDYFPVPPYRPQCHNVRINITNPIHSILMVCHRKAE